MSKPLRLSERWFRLALWVVAFVFAGFLIGLGSTVVGDLPQVERVRQADDFIDHAAADPLRAAVAASEMAERKASRELEQAELQLDTAKKASASARETFDNWIATRHATARPDQDGELIDRTKALDVLKAAEDKAEQRLSSQQQIALDAQQARDRAQERLAPLENKRRKSTYWPFVWGFIFFALFAFFVELVPYLPSYGGYVRYVVGLVITVLLGRYAIVGLNRYLAKQKLAEQQPDQIRREELSYDVALSRLAKNVCPGCERPIDLKSTGVAFCPHCGICLYDHCGHCTALKSAFSKFCQGCGTSAAAPSR